MGSKEVSQSPCPVTSSTFVTNFIIRHTSCLFIYFLTCIIVFAFPILSPRKTAGWELALDFFGHIFGERAAFSGVQMHMGHMCGHYNRQVAMARGSTVAGFFAEKTWRTFLQSGLALYSQALPANVKTACCDLSYLGGDGTPIGLPADGWAPVKQVWEPADDTQQEPCNRSRTERCGIPGGEGDNSPVELCRRFILEVTERKAAVEELRNNLPTHKEHMPEALYDELCTFLQKPTTDQDYEPLRSLIRCFASRHSATGMIPYDIAEMILDRQEDLNSDNGAQFRRSWKEIGSRLRNCQMGPEITRAVEHQLSTGVSGLPRSSTIRLVQTIGIFDAELLFSLTLIRSLVACLVSPPSPL